MQTIERTSRIDRVSVNETFGQYLRRHRKSLELTQEDLGEKAGISQSYVSGLEREINKDIRREDVISLARALSVPVAEALTMAGLSAETDLIRESSIGYFADPDVQMVAEAYEGLPSTIKGFVRSQILSAADLARELDKKETIGGMRSDDDVNPTRHPDN